MASVADEVLRLRFTGGHVESMYRNDERIHDLFVGKIQDSRHGVIILEWSARVFDLAEAVPGNGLVVSHMHTQP